MVKLHQTRQLDIALSLKHLPMFDLARRCSKLSAVLFVAASFLVAHSQSVVLAAADRVPVVLSTDIGNEIDDQWAVAYLLTDKHFDVRGMLSAHAPSLPGPAGHSSYLVLRDVVENHLGLHEHPPLIEGGNIPLVDASHAQPSAAVGFLIEASRGFTAEHRLTVLTIGAATDVASALLTDPTLEGRIRIVAMAFENLGPAGADAYNVQNDPYAWQVILQSNVPLVEGTGDVCRAALSLNLAQARSLLMGHGEIGAWLWDDFNKYYFRHVKPERSTDLGKSWVIWDVITLAYVRGLATAKTVPRPTLDAKNLKYGPPITSHSMEDITNLNTAGVWKEFLDDIDRFQETHAVPAFAWNN